jgi:hypothetical protein
VAPAREKPAWLPDSVNWPSGSRTMTAAPAKEAPDFAADVLARHARPGEMVVMVPSSLSLPAAKAADGKEAEWFKALVAKAGEYGTWYTLQAVLDLAEAAGASDSFRLRLITVAAKFKR